LTSKPGEIPRSARNDAKNSLSAACKANTSRPRFHIAASIQLLRGGRAARGYSRAGIAQEHAGRRGRREIEIICRGTERDVASVAVDRRGGACGIGLGSVRSDGNKLCRGSAAGRNSRAGISHKGVRRAVGIADHQVRRRGNKRHVASVRADRGRNTVSIGWIAAESDGYYACRRRATRRSTAACVMDKYVLCISWNFRDAVGRGQHRDEVTSVRTHSRRGE
jgi:hypothetical protein